MENNITPFFSVIISIFQEDDVILIKSLNSIINQTFTDFELIIVDDNPKRKHIPIQKDSRIKILKNDSNLGLTKSLNKAVKISRGMFIVRQDADDYSALNRLEKTYKFIVKLDKKSQLRLVYSSPFLINKKVKPNIYLKSFFNEEILRYKNFLCHGCLVISSEILKDILYDEDFKFAQDFDLYNRLLDLEYKITFDQNNLSYFLNDLPDRVSRKFYYQQKQFYYRVLKRNNHSLFTISLFERLRIDILLDFYIILCKKVRKK